MSDQSIETLGGYTLLERIGKGGMGEVWRAERVTGGSVRRRAAIKRILPEYQRDPTLRQRFTAEARITARLEHPNIVQVLDFGDAPELYLVLEYVDGVSLADVVRRSAKQPGLFPVAAVLHIIAEAATGLDYAHRRGDESGQPLGIVHRDVSPANVMISVDGAVKVNDFGIARAADNIVRTQAGMAMGKLVYMAPEQAGGERVDRRADVFALGIVLWELLARKPLLPRGDPARTLEALARCEFPPPSSVVTGVPPEVDAIVREALMRDPEQRTPSAARLAKSLRMVLATIAPGFDGRDLARALIELMPELAARASNVSFTAAMPQMAAPGGVANHAPAATVVEISRVSDAGDLAGAASRRLVTSPHPHGPVHSPAVVAAVAPVQQPVAPIHGAPTTRPNLPTFDPAQAWQSPSGGGPRQTFAPASYPRASQLPKPAGRGVGFGLVVVGLLLLVVGGLGVAAFFMRDDLGAVVNQIARSGPTGAPTAAPTPTAAIPALAMNGTTTAQQPICARFHACCYASANLASMAVLNQSCANAPAYVRAGGESACAQLLAGIRSVLLANPETPPVCLEQSAGAPTPSPTPAPTAVSPDTADPCTELAACCRRVPSTAALSRWLMTCNSLPQLRTIGATGVTICRNAMSEMRALQTPGIPPECH